MPKALIVDMETGEVWNFKGKKIGQCVDMHFGVDGDFFQRRWWEQRLDLSMEFYNEWADFDVPYDPRERKEPAFVERKLVGDGGVKRVAGRDEGVD